MLNRVGNSIKRHIITLAWRSQDQKGFLNLSLKHQPGTVTAVHIINMHTYIVVMYNGAFNTKL